MSEASPQRGAGCGSVGFKAELQRQICAWAQCRAHGEGQHDWASMEVHRNPGSSGNMGSLRGGGSGKRIGDFIGTGQNSGRTSGNGSGSSKRHQRR